MSAFGFGHEVVTSTTKPSGAAPGQLIYCQDTDEYLKYMVSYGYASRWMQAVLKPGRNLVINGDMRVNQRGASTTPTTFGGGGTYFCDRFFAQASGSGTIQAARSTDVPSDTSFSTSTKFTVSSAMSGTSSYVNLTTRLEGYESYRSGIQQTGKSTTLSFWVKSSKTGTYSVTIGSGYRGGTTYNYLYYSANFTITGSDIWQFKTITIPGYASASWYTDNAVGLEITFNISAGSTLATGALNTWTTVSSSAGYFYGNASATASATWGASLSDNFLITGVQLEAGTAASEFEYREYGDELRRCLRYYQIAPGSSMKGINSGSMMIDYSTSVPFRATPLFILTNSAGVVTTSPYVESTPWNTVGSLTSATINNGHFGTNGGDILISGTFSPAIGATSTWMFGGGQIRFNAEL